MDNLERMQSRQRQRQRERQHSSQSRRSLTSAESTRSSFAMIFTPPHPHHHHPHNPSVGKSKSSSRSGSRHNNNNNNSQDKTFSTPLTYTNLNAQKNQSTAPTLPHQQQQQPKVSDTISSVKSSIPKKKTISYDISDSSGSEGSSDSSGDSLDYAFSVKLKNIENNVMQSYLEDESKQKPFKVSNTTLPSSSSKNQNSFIRKSEFSSSSSPEIDSTIGRTVSVSISDGTWQTVDLNSLQQPTSRAMAFSYDADADADDAEANTSSTHHPSYKQQHSAHSNSQRPPPALSKAISVDSDLDELEKVEALFKDIL